MQLTKLVLRIIADLDEWGRGVDDFTFPENWNLQVLIGSFRRNFLAARKIQGMYYVDSVPKT